MGRPGSNLQWPTQTLTCSPPLYVFAIQRGLSYLKLLLRSLVLALLSVAFSSKAVGLSFLD